MDRLDRVADHTGTRGDDQGCVRITAADGFQHPQAIHLGHAQIDDDEGRLFGVETLQPHTPVFGGDRLVSTILQVGTETVPDRFVVIDDQYADGFIHN